MAEKKYDKGVAYIGLGMALGAAMSIITKNIGLWLPIGVAIGTSLWAAANAKKSKNEDNG